MTVGLTSMLRVDRFTNVPNSRKLDRSYLAAIVAPLHERRIAVGAV